MLALQQTVNVVDVPDTMNIHQMWVMNWASAWGLGAVLALAVSVRWHVWLASDNFHAIAIG